ncbi:MAG: phytanoyl-CoA dioxygenase family protein [Burkholderiales bacterium]|nr:phytanoyl-CoA dioxygenase family protein [Burkholderiales bacterium]
MSALLSAAELDHYREHGYVFPRYRLPADLLARLRAATDGLLASYTDVAQEDLANPHMIPPTTGPDMNPFMAAAQDPGVLDLVEQVLGPDLILWITRVLCKPPAVGREVPWHQDGEYWPMRPLATASVWIAIDPVSPTNGCMRFIPGSHRRQELYRHHVTDRKNLVLNLELDADQFDETTAVNVELEPGQMSIHDVRLIHGSLANTSGERRAALIMRYMPATSHYDRTLVRQRKDNSPFNIYDQPLWLLRGNDRSERNDLTHGHDLWKQRYAGGIGVASGSAG